MTPDPFTPSVPDDAGSAASPLLLTADQAAALCNIGPRTWRYWNLSGRIPRPLYIGRKPLWRLEELKAWVEAGCPTREVWDEMEEIKRRSRAFVSGSARKPSDPCLAFSAC